MNKYIFILFLFLTSCALYPEPVYFIDPDLQPYVNMYKEHKAYYLGFDSIKVTEIRFGEPRNTKLGECTKWRNGSFVVRRRITLDPVVWRWMSEVERRMLVFHELGHCDLDRPHTVTDSLMVENIFPATQYLSKESYYLQELFLQSH